MEPTGIVMMCSVALVAVFGLLSFLAVVMEGITVLFPERAPTVEPEIVAALSSAVATMFGGAEITRIERIEEER